MGRYDLSEFEWRVIAPLVVSENHIRTYLW